MALHRRTAIIIAKSILAIALVVALGITLRDSVRVADHADRLARLENATPDVLIAVGRVEKKLDVLIATIDAQGARP